MVLQEGEDVSFGVGSEVSKAHTRLSVSLYAWCLQISMEGSQLLL